MFSFDCARMPICVYDADALKLSGGCDCSPMVIWNFCDTCSKRKSSCVVKLTLILFHVIKKASKAILVHTVQ